MSPADRIRVDRLIALTTSLGSLLVVADCPDTSVARWTLQELEHWLNRCHVLVGRLNDPETYPTESGAF